MSQKLKLGLILCTEVYRKTGFKSGFNAYNLEPPLKTLLESALKTCYKTVYLAKNKVFCPGLADMFKNAKQIRVNTIRTIDGGGWCGVGEDKT